MKIVKVWRCLFPLSFFLTISLMINYRAQPKHYSSVDKQYWYEICVIFFG